MSRAIRFAPLLLLTLAGACAATSNDLGAEAPNADAQFDVLRGMAGDWYAVDEDGTVADAPQLSYRVTAAGSSVMETVFPGQEHEMVTLYHKDGGDLVLTHYCALGNQPSMKLVESAPERMAFECTGVGNAASHDEAHMHSAEFVRLGEDRVRTTWSSTENGATVMVVATEMVRK